MPRKVGIIGAGVIGRTHAAAFREMEDAELVGVLDRHLPSARTLAADFGCPAFDSLHRFLDVPEMDVVTICTPSGNHLEPALAAVEAGKHLIVEKPLEITLERCDAMIEAAAQKGVHLTGVFQSRFHEAPKLLKQAVDQGRFGRLSLGDAYVKWFRDQDYYGGGRGTWKLDGGGALMIQSIHVIDMINWLIGPIESVFAFSDTLGHHGIEVEDTAVAALRFANGAMGVIEGTTCAYPGFLKKVEISGTHGSAILEEEILTAWSFAAETDEDQQVRDRFATAISGGSGAWTPDAVDIRGHLNQFAEFFGLLNGEGGHAIDGREARKPVEIVLALYESARTGKAVRVGSGPDPSGP